MVAGSDAVGSHAVRWAVAALVPLGSSRSLWLTRPRPAGRIVTRLPGCDASCLPLCRASSLSALRCPRWETRPMWAGAEAPKRALSVERPSSEAAAMAAERKLVDRPSSFRGSRSGCAYERSSRRVAVAAMSRKSEGRPTRALFRPSGRHRGVNPNRRARATAPSTGNDSNVRLSPLSCPGDERARSRSPVA